MKFENIRVMNFENALRGMRNPKNSWHLSDSEFGIGLMDWLGDISEEMADKYISEYDIEWNDHLFKTISEKMLNHIITHINGDYCEYAAIGPKDMKLAQALIKGGPEHRKFLRQIFVSVDITAPLYWWKEFDTYKVGTVANSTSTMHKITSKPITLDCFEIDDYDPSVLGSPEEIEYLVQFCEGLRTKYLDIMEASKNESLTSDERKKYIELAQRVWKELIRWLPESWLQTRTVTMNYENLLAMCSKSQRRFHKLTEWSGDGECFEHPSFIKFARSLPYAPYFIFIDEIDMSDFQSAFC